MVEVFGGVEFEFRHAQEEVPSDVIRNFHLFCMRYSQLKANMADLQGEEAYISISFSKEQGHVTAKNQSKFNPHRLKGLLLDYRPFVLRRDATEFRMICNQVSKYFSYPEVIRMIKGEKARWDEDALAKWHGRSFDEISDTFFNATLFHTDTKRQEDLIELTSAFDDRALQSILFLGVNHRLDAIRNVAFIVGACTQEHSAIRIPISQLVQKNDVP
jgi:hypothetical protein